MGRSLFSETHNINMKNQAKGNTNEKKPEKTLFDFAKRDTPTLLVETKNTKPQHTNCIKCGAELENSIQRAYGICGEH